MNSPSYLGLSSFFPSMPELKSAICWSVLEIVPRNQEKLSVINISPTLRSLIAVGDLRTKRRLFSSNF